MSLSQAQALLWFLENRIDSLQSNRYLEKPVMAHKEDLKYIITYNDYMKKSYNFIENYNFNPSDDEIETPSDTALVGEATIGYIILGKGIPNKVGEAIVSQSVITLGL